MLQWSLYHNGPQKGICLAKIVLLGRGKVVPGKVYVKQNWSKKD